MKKDVYVSFGGKRQKASELSPELRKKLGIEEVVIESDNSEVVGKKRSAKVENVKNEIDWRERRREDVIIKREIMMRTVDKWVERFKEENVVDWYVKNFIRLIGKMVVYLRY